MILYFKIDINKIFIEGKKYAWPRPSKCPGCGGCHLWGHGYVQRYFEGFNRAVWLKRYRCVDCHGVHTIRPEEYWRRFQSSMKTIVTSLREKISSGRWQSENSRQKQQYWLRGFKKQLMRAEVFWKDKRKQLEIFLDEGIIVSSHSMEWYSTRI